MKLESLFTHIDKKQQSFVDRLREAVGIPSISSSVEHRKDVVKMAEWLETWMKKLHIKYSLQFHLTKNNKD
jgi:Cys-Gly metallodipeptidase DUG1